MMDFLWRTEVMIAMGLLLLLLMAALPAMLLIAVLRANRVPKRRANDESPGERAESV